MAKYYGKVGYCVLQETAPDVWQEEIVEKEYICEIVKNMSRWNGSEHLNDDLTVSNRVSIVADPFAYSNFQSIRYCTFMGAKWKVNSIDVQYPRLILDLGGVYNEQS